MGLFLFFFFFFFMNLMDFNYIRIKNNDSSLRTRKTTAHANGICPHVPPTHWWTQASLVVLGLIGYPSPRPASCHPTADPKSGVFSGYHSHAKQTSDRKAPIISDRIIETLIQWKFTAAVRKSEVDPRKWECYSKRQDMQWNDSYIVRGIDGLLTIGKYTFVFFLSIYN